MYIYQKSINPVWIQCFGEGGRTLTPIWSWSLPEDPILKHPPHFSSIIISKQFRFLIWNIFLFSGSMVAFEGWEKSALEKIPERNPLFLQNAAEPLQMTMVHVCQQFTVAPGLGLRPHSRGGCIIVTGFRVRRSKTISCRKSQMQSPPCQHPRFQAIYAAAQGQLQQQSLIHFLTFSHPPTLNFNY